MAKGQDKKDIATENYESGSKLIESHPVFSAIESKTHIFRNENRPYPKNGLVFVTVDGVIYCHPKVRATSEEWARAIAHCLLHLSLGHFVPKDYPVLWNVACDIAVEKFLNDLKFCGVNNNLPMGIVNLSDENKIYEYLCREGISKEFTGFGTAGDNAPDMLFETEKLRYYNFKNPPDWRGLFAHGIKLAVTDAVNLAAGNQTELNNGKIFKTKAIRAKEWFISSYPLLGAIAANFKIIEDPLICQRSEIHIAAVSAYLGEIYINPSANLSEQECSFVMAHEILHAALRHDERHEWRDAYLWNVACDFVINGWLIEMQVGDRPAELLYDVQFNGMSAEDVYDRIVTDMRMYRKLATLRGVGLGDILGKRDGESFDTDLDEFYRRAISQGLEYHQEIGRGYLPEGLIEEIRALSHPPIPWDVELARWFDDFFVPIEKTRTYARPSRRQSSTPDIPRHNWYISREALDKRTFGVVLDTSGSMDRALLGGKFGCNCKLQCRS